MKDLHWQSLLPKLPKTYPSHISLSGLDFNFLCGTDAHTCTIKHVHMYERGTPATAVHEMESGERRTFEGTIGINKVMEWDRRYLPADE